MQRKWGENVAKSGDAKEEEEEEEGGGVGKVVVYTLARTLNQHFYKLLSIHRLARWNRL